MKIILLTLLLLTTLFSFQSFNNINKKYKFTSEKDLHKVYIPLISAHFYKQKCQYFYTKDNLKIAYKIFLVKNAKATIVISSGRTEGMIKYQELIYDLNQNGYNIYILDHRGQGYSSRMLKDTQIGHVNNFFDYVEDMNYFVNKLVKKDKKLILLGHSMGGAIASLYVETYPTDFNALVLSSPMHQPELLSKSMTNIVCSLVEKRKTNIDKYILGKNNYEKSELSFEKNILTHSKERYELADMAYQKEPETKIGGPSVNWVAQACLWSQASVDMAHKIKIPVLLLQAGEDKVVNDQPQKEFCKNSKGLCKGYKIDGAYHELFIEKDSIREKALTAVLDFISKI